MKTELGCLPCFFTQVARTIQYAGVNGDRARTLVRKATSIIESASLDVVPARTTTIINRLLREELGLDPYRDIKIKYNGAALELLPELRRMAATAADELEASVRIAIAGNIIDFGIYDTVDLEKSLRETFGMSLSRNDYVPFAEAVNGAKRILFLCDNAGEIVFDRVLLDVLRERGKDVIAVVKGAPVINDATLEDAHSAGLHESATVIDNGSDGVGTLLETCSPEFIDAYKKADLIISKGQANYETLMHENDPRIFFLFKVKCHVVASFLDRSDGEIMLTKCHDRSTQI